MAIGKEIDKFVSTFLATYKMMGDNARRDRLFDLEEKKLKGSEDAHRLYADALKAQNDWYNRYLGGGGNGKGGNGGGASSGGEGDVAIGDVYDAFRGAGFSNNQARALTAEVGRENGFQSKFIFGTHADASNSATNAGLLSFQGERRTALMDHLRKAGRIDDNGRIVPGPETLLEQAKFIKQEMPSYARTKREFLNNPNIDPEKASEVLGRDYIKWRYDDPKYASHHETRRGYLSRIPSDAPVGKAIPVERSELPPVAQPQPAAAPAAPPSMVGQPLRVSSNDTEPEVEQTARADQALPMDDTQYAAAGGMIEPSHDEALGAALQIGRAHV